jgi:RHS repeat-associated protein
LWAFGFSGLIKARDREPKTYNYIGTELIADVDNPPDCPKTIGNITAVLKDSDINGNFYHDDGTVGINPYNTDNQWFLKGIGESGVVYLPHITLTSSYKEAVAWGLGSIRTNNFSNSKITRIDLSTAYDYSPLYAKNGDYVTVRYYGNKQYTFYDCSFSSTAKGTWTVEQDSPLTNSSKNLGGSTNSCPMPCAGNPINTGTGNKFQVETDYIGGAATGISLQRFYNSQDSTGSKWQHTWNRGLAVSNSASIEAYREDGRVEKFVKNSAGAWLADPDVTNTLSAVMDGATQIGWRLVTPDDQNEFYSPDGNLKAVVDRAGNTTTLNYDIKGLLESVTGPFGHKLTFTYNTDKSIKTVSLPDGGVITYSYDNNANLTSVKYPDGAVRQYVYNEPENTSNTNLPGALTGIIDENGTRFAIYHYDAQGRAISSEHAGGAEKVNIEYKSDANSSVTDALGNVHGYTLTTQFGVVKPTEVTGIPIQTVGGKALSYDANGFVASRTDWNGNVTTYTRDARGLELTRTEASGTSQARAITTAWHSKFHLPVKITEPSGIAGTNRITSLTYDDTQGNLLTKTISAGNLSRTWNYTYNQKGQITSSTDPKGNTTKFAYDANGGLSQLTNALNQSTSIINDANGRPIKMTDPNGLITQITYTPRGQVASRSVGQELTRYSYDPAGNLANVNYPNGASLTYAYNAAHQLTRVTDAFGNHIDFTLDAIGNRVQTIVYNSSNTAVRGYANKYDALSRPIQIIGSQKQTTTLQYDLNGNLTGITDPLGNKQSNAYDALNRLTQETDPNGGQIRYAYDNSDSLNQVTDPLKHNTGYTRDALGELLKVSSPDTGNTTNTYDAAGNLASTTDARGKITQYDYDALNRITTIRRHEGGLITFKYDSEANSIGHLVSMTDDTGDTHWSYDTHGRVIAKTQSFAGEQLSKITYTYDSAGNLAQMTYPSGLSVSYSYDKGRLLQINANSNPLVSNIGYVPFGGITSMRYANGTTYSRKYDADGRISQYTVLGARSIALNYDAASRITQYQDSEGVVNQNMAYDKLGRIVNVSGYFGNEIYSYDNNGNRLSHTIGAQTGTYTYEKTSNRLQTTAVKNGSVTNTIKRNYDAAGNTLNIGDKQFTYNDLGRMATGSGASYFYNGLGQRIYKSNSNSYVSYDETGHMIGEYTYHGPLLNETVYIGDIPVAVLTPAGTNFINADHLNTPRLITDNKGDFKSFWPFVPFGEKKSITSDNSLTYNARFPGQQYDAETGLHYNGFRDYDPSSGRYVESDPIGLQGGLNSYAYVKNNPILFIDKKGLTQEDIKGILEFTIELQEKIIRSNQEKQLFEITKSGDYLIEPGIGVTINELAKFFRKYSHHPWIKLTT